MTSCSIPTLMIRPVTCVHYVEIAMRQRQQDQRPPAQPGHLLDSAARYVNERLVSLFAIGRGCATSTFVKDSTMPSYRDTLTADELADVVGVSRDAERTPAMNPRTRALAKWDR